MNNFGGNLNGFARAMTLAIILLIASIGMPTAGLAQAGSESGIVTLSATTNTQTIKVARAKPKTIRTDTSFSEIVVGDPEIAVVSPLTDRSFYVIGSQPGTTGIALYNDQNELVGMIDIEVGPNTHQLNNALQAALPKSNVRATTTNGRVILSGSAKDSVAASKARAIAERYDEDIIDTVSVQGSQQVKLEVRFIEAQRSKGKELGIGWRGVVDGVTKASVPALGLISGAQPFGSFVASLLDSGVEVDALVRALENRGVARRLAEPNLVALSGETASFLAGGEFPIPTAGDGDEIKIEFKRFGVGLEFTPTVLENGLINLKIAPEVSQIDNTNAVPIGPGGALVPAIIVRRAETTIELRDGQSFVLAGLLQSNSSYDKQQLPWLGDIPILGALFRSAAYRKNETDLIIIVTPRLIKPIAPGTQISTPLDSHAPGNDVDIFANGDLEVSRAHLRRLAEMRSGTLKAGHIIEFD